MSGYPINTAILTGHSLHVQNYDVSERVHLASWTPWEGSIADPAALMEDADTQLRLAGWQRNHGWTYLPIPSDGMRVSIRPLKQVYDVTLRVESEMGHGELLYVVGEAVKAAGISYRSAGVRVPTPEEMP